MTNLVFPQFLHMTCLFFKASNKNGRKKQTYVVMSKKMQSIHTTNEFFLTTKLYVICLQVSHTLICVRSVTFLLLLYRSIISVNRFLGSSTCRGIDGGGIYVGIEG